MPKFTTRSLIISAVLIAIGVLLGSFSVYFGPAIKITFAPLIIILSGALLGPFYGGAIGALTDIISLLIKPPQGAYFPGFTITMALYGILAGVFLFLGKKTFSAAKIIISVLVIQVICSLFINTGWLVVLTGSPYFALMATRIPASFVSFGLYAVILIILMKNKEKFFPKLSYTL